MDRNRATLDAYDGIELELLSGEVVRAPALTIAEVAHYLRLGVHAQEGRFRAIDDFLRGFPARIGIEGVRLEDLGFDFPRPAHWPYPIDERPADLLELGDLTVADGLAMAEVYGTAVADAYDVESSRAKLRILDEIPVTFGLEELGLDAGEVFLFAQTFAQALYQHIYGLAASFLDHLTRSPRAKVVKVTRATPPPARSSKPASTT